MKVLVTGANGLLGSNLIRKLLQENYAVKAFVRRRANLFSLKGIDTEIFYGHILERSDLSKALKGCNVVVHAAAKTSQWPTAYENYYHVNIEATRILLEESLTAGIERFIYVGSANAFGPGTLQNPGDEESIFTEVQSRSGYMFSKFMAQQMVLDFSKKHEFPAVVVNPSFMLGKFDAKPSSGQMLLMAHGKKLMPCPMGGKNFIHVDDVATGIIRAIEKGKNSSSYLLANENLSYYEFFGKMKSVCGYPQRLIKLPKIITNIAGGLGGIFEAVSGKPAKLNRINSRLLVSDNYYSAKKAMSELGLPQTPVEVAIRDALDWFDKTGYLF